MDPSETIRWRKLERSDQAALEARIARLAGQIENAKPAERVKLRTDLITIVREYNSYDIEEVTAEVLIRGANACADIGAIPEASVFAQRAILKNPFELTLRDTMYDLHKLDKIAPFIQFPQPISYGQFTARDYELRLRKDKIFEILVADKARATLNWAILRGLLTHNDYTGKKQEIHYTLANDHFLGNINTTSDRRQRAHAIDRWTRHLAESFRVIPPDQTIPGIIDQYPIATALEKLTLPNDRSYPIEEQLGVLAFSVLQQLRRYITQYPHHPPVTPRKVLAAFDVRTTPLSPGEFTHALPNMHALDRRIALIGEAYAADPNDTDLAYLYAEALLRRATSPADANYHIGGSAYDEWASQPPATTTITYDILAHTYATTERDTFVGRIEKDLQKPVDTQALVAGIKDDQKRHAP